MKFWIKMYAVVLICLFVIYLIRKANTLSSAMLLVILFIILLIGGLTILFIRRKPTVQETSKTFFWKKYDLEKIMETEGNEATILKLKTISINNDITENDRIIASQLLELYIKAYKFI